VGYAKDFKPSAQSHNQGGQAMNEYSKYVGLDTHKDTIAVAVADFGRSNPRYYGEIPNTPEAIIKLVNKLSPDGEVLSFCYEAGPCGYGIYRQLTQIGHDCAVVAPSLIPRRAGDRVKTDRRDSETLCRLHRSGELTAVWVPDHKQEAVRDLTRAREDMKQMERKARQRMNYPAASYGVSKSTNCSRCNCWYSVSRP